MLDRRYVLLVLAICVAGYAGLFLFARTPAYCALTKNFADTTPCYKLAVQGKQADILLVGDSSLLYGIDPRIVEPAARRSVYNYGLVGPVFGFDPAAIVDHYLATNSPPRAVIVYLSPWDVIQPGRVRDPIWFPVGLAALQFPDVISFGGVLRERPSALVELPPIITSSIGLSTNRSKAWHAQTDDSRGFFDFAAVLDPGDRQLTNCPGAATPPLQIDTGPSRVTFERLKQRYAARGIPIHFYVAPFARCGADLASIKKAYAGLAENEPVALDDRLFANERHAVGHVHVNADGVRAASDLLGHFILTHNVGGRQ